MRLKMLGGLALEGGDLSRPKPLLLLAYLAVEGSKEKRHLHELFWPEAAAQGSSLRMAISQVRKVSANLLASDEHTVSTGVETDLAGLQKAISERDAEKLEGLYQGEFLQGFSLPDWSAELEEWVYSTREFIAARVRGVLIRVAETEAAKGAFGTGAGWAEKAYRLERKDPEPEELERLYPLLVAGGSALSGEVKQQAQEYGLDLNLTPGQAKEKYFVATSGDSLEPRTIPHNLPRAKTSFVGRDPELVEVGQVISQSEVQLITLLGPGGIGKTRLALQLASNQLQENHFPDGVYFVALEALSEPGQIPAALAQVLGLKVKDDPMEAVKAGIGGKQMLLVLDNFEHLMDGALLVSELLEACPQLNLLVTSRERLNLEEEFVFSMEGLPLPKGGDLDLSVLEYNDAVKLFVQRAKRARLEFQLSPLTLPQVLNICRFVGGSPLGIELAAVWLRSLPIGDIADEIGKIMDGLEIPLRNTPERHQSLKAVFEHSWKLLKPKEQLTLARLSTFLGGFTREAASVVTQATIPLLTSLVDKSLLRLSAEGRYDFHPLLYQYASEKLAELLEEKEQTRARQGHYFLNLVEASQKAGVQAQIKGCKEEHQNLLSALAWSQEANQALIGLRLGSALAPFWRTQGYFSEGRYWITQVLSHPAAAAATAERNETLIYAAQIATDQSDHALALAYGQEALVIAQTLGHDALRARAFSILASVARQQGDYEAAQHHGQAALELSRKLAQDELVAHALLVLSNNAGDMGKLGQARALAQESLTIYRKLGSRFQLGLNLNTLGFLGWMSGDLNEAKNYLEEALVIALDLPDLDLACLVQSNLGGVMLDLGEWTPAQSLAGQALEYRWAQKDKWGLAYSLENFASLVLQKEGRQAACLWGVAERLRQEIHAPMPPSWRIRYERFVGVAKSQVDQASFSAAWQEGTGMSLEEAVKYALETTVAQAALQKR